MHWGGTRHSKIHSEMLCLVSRQAHLQGQWGRRARCCPHRLPRLPLKPLLLLRIPPQLPVFAAAAAAAQSAARW